MNFITLFFISIGLSMDAFAVSLTEGISLKKMNVKHIFKVAIVFGIFQGVMPLIGWKIGSLFSHKIEAVSHIVAFALLVFIGIKMIIDARSFGKCDLEGKCETKSNIVALGIATSIDALVIGLSFSLLPGLNIYYSILIIGLITFILSALGVYLGSKVGQLLGAKAEYVGGIILILMGIKVLF